MTAKLTPNLRLRNAKDFLENLVNHPITPPNSAADGSHAVDRSHYLFIGRTKAWPTNLVSNPVVSETSPPTPANTIVEDRALREDMIALKKVRDIDATLCIRRFNWDATGNTVYKPYDVNDPELFAHPTPAEIQAANLDGRYFAGSGYVLTDEYHLFKCLNNNNNSKSTVKPTLPLNPPFTVSTSDGYVWKYVTTVSQFQVQYFLTNQWIPVKTLSIDDGSKQWSVQIGAVKGAIDSFLLSNQGSGYTNVHSGAFVNSSSNTAQLPNDPDVAVVDNAYVGMHCWITGGTGFPSGPFVISGYQASTRQITITGSWSVDVGTTYEILPRVVISGNGASASAKCLVDNATGKVQAVIPVSAGTNYTTAEVSLVGGTTGTPAVVVPQIAPGKGHGADIERELNAAYVMLTARLVYDDGSNDFPLANDYRQVGLIRDILAPNGSLANASTLRALNGLRLVNIAAGVGGIFQPDELISGTDGVTTSLARIVSFIPGPGAGDGTIYYYQDSSTGYGQFTSNFSIVGVATSATGNVDAGGVLAPEVDKFSGDVLYIDNRRSILRAPNQTEIIRAVIRF